MAFNFFHSLTAREQNAKDESTPVDEFDYDSDESDAHLDRGDPQGEMART